MLLSRSVAWFSASQAGRHPFVLLTSDGYCGPCSGNGLSIAVVPDLLGKRSSRHLSTQAMDPPASGAGMRRGPAGTTCQLATLMGVASLAAAPAAGGHGVVTRAAVAQGAAAAGLAVGPAAAEAPLVAGLAAAAGEEVSPLIVA